MSPLSAITDDVLTLLNRALFEKDVFAFGEDGFGQHGRRDIPLRTVVDDVQVMLSYDETADDLSGRAYVVLRDYDSCIDGHICTDRNFLICIGDLLEKAHIERDVLSYAPVQSQEQSTVVMDIDVHRLIAWP